ncbi:MAG: hypothetical protein KGZ81_10425 [Flavobacteriales bacterium]|nr:hypothetical protein [Flavobacteriales bacterium]
MMGLSSWLSIQACRAQTDEIQQLLLNVEKLDQLKEMLDNMQEKYRILSQGYQQIKGIAEGNFQLHQAFLDRLVRVNPNVRAYYKVGEIIQLQIGLVRGIEDARTHFQLGDYLQDKEFQQVNRLLGTWSKSSFHLLEELMLILSDNQLQMDDGERIQAIDRVHESLSELSKGVGKFSNSLSQLGELRKSKSQDLQTLQTLLGSEN